MSLISSQKILEILNDPRLELSGFQFSEEMIRRNQRFLEVLHKWNRKINLVSEKNVSLILEKHVFDSLQYLRWLGPSHKTIDIGSGGGFPGLPVKMFLPDMDMTLLDSQRKRCNFLREVVRELGFEKISVLEGRAEQFSGKETFKERFERVLLRGFGSLATCLAVGSPYLKAGGRMILMKSPEEIEDFPKNNPHGALMVDTRTVAGFDGKNSLMMVIEKCST